MLTDSELRLLPLLEQGMRLGEIAQLLELPREEVVAQSRALYPKLGETGRRQLEKRRVAAFEALAEATKSLMFQMVDADEILERVSATIEDPRP
jgi:DNA-binding transcriptional MerR regulator